MPSGNISCVLGPGSVRCDIRTRDWQPPAKPADCHGDYGQGLVLQGSSPGTVLCATDSVLGNLPPLPYGQSASTGDVSCLSSEANVTCRNSVTGHGFELARQTFKVF